MYPSVCFKRKAAVNLLSYNCFFVPLCDKIDVPVSSYAAAGGLSGEAQRSGSALKAKKFPVRPVEIAKGNFIQPNREFLNWCR